MKKSILIFAAILMLGSMIDLNQSYARTEIFVCKAVNESGEFEYTERHELIFEGGKVIRSKTIYLDHSNRVIGIHQKLMMNRGGY